MAFIRVKKVRGHEYAYLVESRWDPKRRTSRQATLKYLGALDRLRLDDVPAEHRTKSVRSFILRHSTVAEDRRKRLAHQFVGDLSQALVRGDRKQALAVAEEVEGVLGLDALYVDVLTPAMHRIGERWRRGDISITVEHLASNIAGQTVDRVNAVARAAGRRRGSAVLCTPPGEMHNLATKVLEGLLLRRGHAVMNVSASAPMESILGFLESRKPDFVLISLTIAGHLPAARRLAWAIRNQSPRIRIFVGGQGVPDNAAGFPPGVALNNSALAVLDALEAPAS